MPERLERASNRGTRFEAATTDFLLSVDGVGRYRVENGNTITIEREAQASEQETRLFLFGTTWSALLHQRGILPLHAAAVESRSGAVLFAGRSGSGKSTLLAALVSRGFRIIADDIVGLTVDDGGRPIVHPGFPGIKLWADAAARLGYDPSTLQRVRPQLQKYYVHGPSAGSTPLPLEAVYVLQPEPRPGIAFEALAGASAFDAINNETRVARVVKGLPMQVRHLTTTAAVVNRARVTAVRRPVGAFTLDELVARVERELQ